MKIKAIIVLAFFAAFMQSCVTKKKFDALNSRFKNVSDSLQDCSQATALLLSNYQSLKSSVVQLENRIELLKADSIETNNELNQLKAKHTDLTDNYNKLLKNSNAENQKLLASLKELDNNLKEREKMVQQQEAELTALRTELETKQNALKQREQRVKELEAVIASKDSATNALRNQIATALTGFTGNGLTVEIKDGKVYVSMEEQLLFASGSIEVDPKGKTALLQLSKALNKMPDINILVEGHTDDVPMNGVTIKDNWDLSVLRATSIVKILANEGKLGPERIIASGRGPYFPVAKGNTTEARKKNRRTEIILSPKLDELYQLLNKK